MSSYCCTQEESLVNRPGTSTTLRRFPPRMIAPWQGVRYIVGEGLARLGALPYDSRERLRSKEQDLASRGIRWAADAADDAILARELEAARRRRMTSPQTLI